MAGPDRLTAVAGGPSVTVRATIVDVAAAAGVSRQTVTRAMNDMSGISPGTKRRVLDAVQDLGYRPSRFGRGLVKPQQRTLGLLVTDLTNPYYPELASAVIGAAAELGWNVLIAEERHSNDRRRQLEELAAQVDALVGYVYADRGDPDRGDSDQTDPGRTDPDRRADDRADDLDRRLVTIPLVRIDALPDQRSHGVVGLNIRLAVEQAIERLAEHGVVRPVVIDNSGSGVPSQRAELFLAGWQARGVDAELITVPGDTAEHGADGVTRALSEVDAVDALICFNDLMALGALGALRRRGVDVPGRIRVLGVDGLSVGALVSPALTTLSIDLAEVARHAVQLAVGMDRGDVPRSGPAARRSVSYRLLVRESG